MTGAPEVAAIILAAGTGSRFAPAPGDSKVLAPYRGRPLLAHVVAAVTGSRASSCIVVTGHAGDAVAAAIDGLAATRVQAADHAQGLAHSLRAGLTALPPSTAGVLILLADMPLVESATLDRLIAAFETHPAIEAVVPLYRGARGNPVLLSRSLFPDIARLDGDEGARRVLGQPHRRILDCAVDDPGIMADVDTQDALRRLPTGP
jgi:molybdenum cofactor cytidylyltransferase